MTSVFISRSLTQGANASQLEKDIGSDRFPPNEHYFGLANVRQIFHFVIFCFKLLNCFYHTVTVWKYMLLQLCITSALLLQTFPRKSSSVQTSAKNFKTRDIVVMSCWPFPLDYKPKEESWFYSAQEIHSTSEKRKRWIVLDKIKFWC